MYVQTYDEVNLGVARIPAGATLEVLEILDGEEHVMVNDWYEYGCTIYKLPGTALFHKSQLIKVSEQ